jgi:signal transduction histidine kinase/ActR/RegA family two-component response regulator
LRLDTDRSFLSLIDGTTQYMVAEATRTTSLANTNVDEKGDPLYLGNVLFEAEWGVCPSTMRIFTDETGSLSYKTDNIVAKRSGYIIRDFRADPLYEDRPYIKSWPFMRSYAEVPLISPLGYVIGGYCVVDNRLRDFDDVTLGVLSEVSKTIVSHLENVRLRHSYNRSERLIRGLGTFIQEETTYRQSRSGSMLSHRTTRTASVTQSSISFASRKPADNERSAHGSESSDSAYAASSGESVSRTTSQTPPASVSDLPSIQESLAGTSLDPTSESDELRLAFGRSAKLIQESMGMDGLVFLDASPTGVRSRQQQANLIEAETLGPADSITSNDNSDDVLGLSASTAVSHVLASSFPVGSAGTSITVPQGLVYRLVRSHTKGTILSADADGPFEKRFTPVRADSERSQTPHRRGSKYQTDVAELFIQLPGACSLVFLPLWHFQKERWYAVAIGWTVDPRRSFNPSDATFLSAFGNSIMSEVLRLETLSVSNAKSDFISSISHELRSPLHGILATTELLSEITKSSEEHALLDMVRSCGTTLLDTMNHLLEYAKINSLTRNRKLGKAPAGDNRLLKLLQGSTDTDLGELVEEVVENVMIGFAFDEAVHTETTQENVSTSMARLGVSEVEPELPVLVSIHVQPHQNWIMSLDPGGWKRIVLNLFGNALKYTPNGSITVSLAVDKQLAGDHIRLTVKDTGIGMSHEYQSTNLFRPFMQENSLSSGAGLGLYLVQQIVWGRGGTIDVESQIGIGTCVTVLLPFPKVSLVATPSASEKPFIGHINRLRGRKLCFIEAEGLHEEVEEQYGSQKSITKYRHALKTAVFSIAKDWLGVDTVSGTPKSITSDIFMMDDSLGPAFAPSDDLIPSHLDPLLVISAPRSNTSKRFPAGITLRLPFGPRRLAATLIQAIDQAEERRNPPSMSMLVSENGSVHKTRHPGPKQLPSPPEGFPFNQISPPPVVDIASPNTPNSMPSPVSGANLQCRHHVLVVDDNAINLKILVTLIKRLGCSFMTANNGYEAVQLYMAYSGSAEPFTYVFMDISMPVMNGFQATREIRAHEAENSVPAAIVVALTGLGSESSEKEAFECGMNLFLRKPVPLSKLKVLLIGDETT